MNRIHFSILCLLACHQMIAQNQANGVSTKKPAGATVVVADGSTQTRSGLTLSTSTSDYNVVQVTNGTLTLTDCLIEKSGDYSSTYSSDDTSFYGTNSAIYASGNDAIVNLSGGTITTNAKGANAVFATNGATITVSDVTIDNSKSVSRGLHCTGGGTIHASKVNITTHKETSSAVATDRGGGSVTVEGGTITAKGKKSAVIYSTGTISVDHITGLSEQGPLTTVEGSNKVIIKNSTMTSGSDARGILLHQSTSGDADGSFPVCDVSNSTLVTTDSAAPLCFVTNVAATLTLKDVKLDVKSGKLMSVEYYKRGMGSTGTLSLQTTQSQWIYEGTVDADNMNNVAVEVGGNVTWKGAIDSDHDAAGATITVENGAVWSLTADSYTSTLINNGTIYTNGFILSYDSKSGNGTINNSSGISPVNADNTNSPAYQLNGSRADNPHQGIVVVGGKKYLKH